METGNGRDCQTLSRIERRFLCLRDTSNSLRALDKKRDGSPALQQSQPRENLRLVLLSVTEGKINRSSIQRFSTALTWL